MNRIGTALVPLVFALAAAACGNTPPTGSAKLPKTPASLEPSAMVTSSATVGTAAAWTDRAGRQLPRSRVGEGSICGGLPTFLMVDGHAYSLQGGYPRARLLGSFAADVPVPGDAGSTGYRNGERRLWIAADGRSAYVGTRQHAERLPRIRHDDTSVTDCN